MNRYEYQNEYQTQRQQEQKNRQKKHNTGWKVAMLITMAAVLATCIISVSVLLQSKRAAADNTPAVTAMSQSLGTESVSGQLQTTETTSGIMLTDVSSMVEQAMPSVVSITSRSIVTNYGYQDIWDYIMNQGRGQSQRSQGQQEEVDSGIGSGTIVGMNDNELLILTSYHVVDGCSSLYVTFTDDTSVDGYIKSAAEDLDIAVVAVPLDDIPDETKQVISVAKLCTDGVKVGEGIVVIGNALGYGQSVITGVVSATNRELEGIGGETLRLIQTDAAINAGNSGGCMLNAKGEIVGISEAKISDASVEGMCYAIPILENLDVIEELLGIDLGGVL